MYWREKIEILKSKFQPSDFKDPFINGRVVVDKIRTIFFTATSRNFIQAENRPSLLKSEYTLKCCNVRDLHERELISLNDESNYWLLLIDIPMGDSFQVYDCKYQPLRELLYLSSGLSNQDFCIVDKKYLWLKYFRIDSQENRVEIYSTIASVRKT